MAAADAWARTTVASHWRASVDKAEGFAAV